ncbi:hypothetical protein Bhyg_06774 [Pseudolycoriella hygida]|uniref:Uncharacterized protein n=1 Tax=Pseudolycoriella hygida TaxID=35572 RepID=A0A9Q0N370_9DIPT|nr:hypothetical protein Bhyg_06774 [Pseudolycoriella hygida]
MFLKILLLCSIAIIGFCDASSSLCYRQNFFPIQAVNNRCNECCWDSFNVAANIAKYTLCSKMNQFWGQGEAKSAENILKNIHDLGLATLKISKDIQCDDDKAIKYVVCDFAARVRCFNNVLASCDATKALENLQSCVVATATAAAANIATLSSRCQDVTNNSVTSALAPIQSYYADPTKFQKDLPAVVASNCC